MISEGRPEADRAVDDRRRAADTVSLAELEPGLTVLEMGLDMVIGDHPFNGAH
ncbi:hypothetical protein [uncultured Roseobacter sp.]|uniref:hypothetical protein n=1 Tax=uncultured Roseobacter sp. TaxID=114847 RepID=UPI00261088DC|nr:hypothetical protein [uncultured Roseobacter sp.]